MCCRVVLAIVELAVSPEVCQACRVSSVSCVKFVDVVCPVCCVLSVSDDLSFLYRSSHGLSREYEGGAPVGHHGPSIL